MKCPHCKGSGELPKKEWRLRRTTVQEVVVVAATREEAVAEVRAGVFGNAKKAVTTTAAPLRPLELRSPCCLGTTDKSDSTDHISDGKKVLCGAKAHWNKHRRDLDPLRLCGKCRELAEKAGLFEGRRVI